MADNNYNIIKPVETLQNIKSIEATKRREERNKRKNQQQDEQQPQSEPDEQIEEDTDDKILQRDYDRHSIDYRA